MFSRSRVFCMEFRIVVFLKAPRPGQVKTRLAASIGAEAACQAYILLAETFLSQLVSFSDVELRFAPDDACDEIGRFQLHPAWKMKQQGAGDLGQRMERAVLESLAEVDAVLCLGTDCPYVGMEDIRQAFGILAEHDAVLGPAVDGGYWAVGLRKSERNLFHEMPWSTAEVLEITRNRLAVAKMSFQELRELEDVDDLESWQRFEDFAAPR